MLGLTRYAGEGDSGDCFAMSAGGGVKLFPMRHLGLRLDGRLFAEAFVSAFRAPGADTCFVASDVAFQVEVQVVQCASGFMACPAVGLAGAAEPASRSTLPQCRG